MGRQIKQNVFLFFFFKHSWFPKKNTVGKYVLTYKRRNINQFTRVYQLEFIYECFQTKEEI